MPKNTRLNISFIDSTLMRLGIQTEDLPFRSDNALPTANLSPANWPGQTLTKPLYPDAIGNYRPMEIAAGPMYHAPQPQ